MSIVELARPELRELAPYEAAIQADDTIRLNANEAPWANHHDRFRRPLNRYPEIRPAFLQRALGARYGCDPERLLVTRGTSEAIDLLIRAFCRAGTDNIVTTRPTFSMYRHYAEVQGAELREVPTHRNEDFVVDVDAVLDACDANSRLVFLCSPNNPTGTSLPDESLVRLLERRGNRSAIVVDEAYIEFAGQASSVRKLDLYENLVVLRTLSKALAFAGARCGSVIGPVDVIRLLSAIQAPYALATPVVECLENAIQAENLSDAEARVEQIVSERERLIDELRHFGFVRRIWPSAANFFLVEIDNAGALMARSAKEKVLLRRFGGDLADCVRVTVGAPEENQRLMQVFAALAGDSNGD